MNKKTKKWMSWIFFIIGGGIIFFTHIWMLINGLTEEQNMIHAVFNLASASLVTIAYFMRR